MAMQQLPTVTAEQLGEAVGRIAGFAALSLHESYPHLNLDRLVETFTRSNVTDFLAKRYLSGLDGGKTPGEAAGDAGAALIGVWADARNEARAQLNDAR